MLLLHKSFQSYQILVYEISETLSYLSDIVLTENSQKRLESMKSEQHQKGFLSVRHLLKVVGLSDFDLFYDETGKPHLKNGKHISITHSGDYSAIIISDFETGIDIERMKTKTINIAPKFCKKELENIDANDSEYLKKITTIWGAKEAVFKIVNQKGISFNDHIFVELNENKTSKAILNFDYQKLIFEIHFFEVNDYVVVFGFELKN